MEDHESTQTSNDLARLGPVFSEVIARTVSVPDEELDRRATKLQRQEAYREIREQERLSEDRWRSLQTRFGERYRDATLESFEVYDDAQRRIVGDLEDYAANMRDRVQRGEGLIFFGPWGTGKDHLLVSMMRIAVCDYRISADWRNGMRLYADFRDAIDRDESESHAVHKLVDPTILALSDPQPPQGSPTAFQLAKLFEIIDERYRRCRPTWVTLNVASKAEAEQRLGGPLVDRLIHGSTALYCKWPSFRSKDREKP